MFDSSRGSKTSLRPRGRRRQPEAAAVRAALLDAEAQQDDDRAAEAADGQRGRGNALRYVNIQIRQISNK